MSNFAKQQIWDGTDTATISSSGALQVEPNTAQILTEILAQLILLNMNFASCAPSAHVDQDQTFISDVPSNS